MRYAFAFGLLGMLLTGRIGGHYLPVIDTGTGMAIILAGGMLGAGIGALVGLADIAGKRW